MRTLTPEKREACRLAILGQNTHTIALHTGLTYDQVRYALSKNNVRLREYRTASTALAKYILYQSATIRKKSYEEFKRSLDDLRKRKKA